MLKNRTRVLKYLDMNGKIYRRFRNVFIFKPIFNFERNIDLTIKVF